MKKSIIKISLLSVSLGLVFSFGYTDTKKSDKTVEKSIKSVSISTTEQKDPMDKEGSKFFYNSKGKPDPMDVPWFHKVVGGGGPSQAPPPVQIDVAETLKGQLTGIVYSESNPSTSTALIGSKIVKIGDNVKITVLPKTIKISKIDKQEVMVTYEGKPYPVKIPGSNNLLNTKMDGEETIQ